MSASRATIPHAKAASFLGGFLLSDCGSGRRGCIVANGWIKLNRKLLQSPCFRNRELLQLWIWLLLSVNHEEGKAMIGNQIIKVSSGQTLTGRNKIAEATGLNSSKVERLLKVLEIEQQIEQQTFTKYRIITVTNWNKYQIVEQQSEQQVNNKRTASEHKQEGKEGKEKKERKPKTYSPESLRLSGLMATLVLENNPDNIQLGVGKREATVNRWAKDIDNLMRLDGRTEIEVEETIRWCQKDSFWSANILSGKTLRKKWDQLRAKMKTNHGNIPGIQASKGAANVLSMIERIRKEKPNV